MEEDVKLTGRQSGEKVETRMIWQEASVGQYNAGPRKGKWDSLWGVSNRGMACHKL